MPSAAHMGARVRPLLVINPVGDARFVRACEALVDAGVTEPEELQASLRDGYPAAVVRPRSLSGEVTVVWYVYRDGHWVSSS